MLLENSRAEEAGLPANSQIVQAGCGPCGAVRWPATICELVHRTDGPVATVVNTY